MVYRNCILDCMYFKVHHTHPAYSAPEVDTAPQAAIPLLGGEEKAVVGLFQCEPAWCAHLLVTHTLGEGEPAEDRSARHNTCI